MFFPALLAKILSAGAVAQAATGAGIVLVAFTGAGAAGALPDSLQHGFATVAETVGIQVEDPQQTDDAMPETPTPSTPDDTAVDGTMPTTGDDTDAPAAGDEYGYEDWERGPAEGQSFGDWVSEGARLGYANGAIISQRAHEKGVVPPTETAEPTEDSGDSGDSGDEAVQTTVPTSTSHGNGNANRGPGASGNGNGSGHGNSGGDGSGRGDD